MPELICPKCGRPLLLNAGCYRCGSGHCYDRAASGYVNLLPPTPGGRRHGDDKLMVRARMSFLDKGYYDPLSNEIAGYVEAFAGETVHIVDAGCGEGKYTVDVLSRLTASGKAVDIVGIDISKEALIRAAKRSGALKLCVASTAHMPLAAHCADVLLNIFSPFMAGEFARVLRPGGQLIRVVPLEKHLWELKELIYARPLPNPPMDMEAEGFRLLEQRELKYTIELHSSGDIMNLFMMTPYYYKTGAADQEKAARAEHLKTTVQFGLYFYERL